MTTFFRGTRSHITRNKVTKSRVSSFEIIISFFFRNIKSPSVVALFFWNPNAPVVAQRFGHQRKLRLVLAGNRNAGRMYLREARITEVCPFFVRLPNGRGVAAHCVGGELKHVAV